MGLLPEPPPPPWAETWPRDLRNVKPALLFSPRQDLPQIFRLSVNPVRLSV